MLPATGSISFNDLAEEFGDVAPVALNEYYADGALVPIGTVGKLGLVPSAGALSLNAFRGSSGSLLSGAHWTSYSTNQPNYSVGSSVAVGSGMMVTQYGLRSFDSGRTWIRGTTTIAAGNDMYEYAGGKFWHGYTTAGPNANINVQSSEDGLNWSNILISGYTYAGLTGVCAGSVYYQTRWCVAAYKSLYGYTVWTSTDGISFNQQSDPANTPGANLIFFPEASGGVAAGGDGMFINYGGYAQGYIATSPDGVAWTKRAILDHMGSITADYIRTKACILNGMFIALTAKGKTVTSTDGINFVVSATALPNAVSVYEIESSGSYVLAIYKNTAGYMVTAYTMDGISWTAITTLDISTKIEVYWLKCVGSRFVAMLDSPGARLLWTVPV